jgi:subtilase family serine protease
MQFWKLAVPLLASTLCFATQSDRITGPIDSSQTVVLVKSHHPNAQPKFDLGVVDPSFKLSYMTLLLAPSPGQQKDLDQLLAQQQDRSSPLYHKWLTPQQFGERFGLTQNDLNKVMGWLQSEGFQILSIGGGHNSVIFSGTAAQAQHAFGAEIHNYRVNGEVHIANSTPLALPAALNGIVRSVMGLHDFRPQPAYRDQLGARRNGRANYYDGNYIWPNFLAPGDMATIYGITALYSAATPIDGTGQTLAIAGQTDIFLSDINDFRTGFGLSAIPFNTVATTGQCTVNASGIVISPCNTTNFQYVLVGSDPGFVSGNDIGEADLDIEWSGAIARNAQIIFINGQTFNGVFDAMTAAINPPAGPPLATVVSASYGEGCEAQATLDLETVFQQGNAEGVTILNSSGDIGAASCDFNPPNASQPFLAAVGGLGVSYPASSPEVTAVGGTEISIANDSTDPALWSTTIGANGGTAVTYIPEIAWNDDVELAQYCHAPAQGDTFCSTGNGTRGWVPLTTAATASQVQQDIWISSSGGGASNCWYETPSAVCLGPGAGPTTGGGFPQPTWQQGLSVPGAPAGVRYVPDVSLFASPNFPGYVFCTPINSTVNGSTCESGIFTAVDIYQSLVGGTSVSSPAFAGVVALLNQYVVANGLQATPGLGNVNPMLYTLAANPSNGAFHQVTSGNNDVYCKPSTPAGQPANVQCPAAGVLGFDASNFDAATHYNLVTGLGSVNVDALFLAWAGGATAPNFTLAASAASPASVSAGQSASVTLTIAPVNNSTQTINFTPSSCTGQPAGVTCSFSPSGVTLDGTNSQTVTMTIATAANMAPATTTITVKGTASGVGGPSQTAQVSLTVTATIETFSLSTTSGASTFTVGVGGTIPVGITVNGTNGFIVGTGAGATTALQITYTCTGSPSLPASEIACTISPGNGQPTNATAVTVTLVTTPPTAQLRPPFGGKRIFYALLLPGLFGIVFAGSRKRGLHMLSLIVVLGFSTLWLGSCGGGSSTNTNPKNPGTPKQTYTVTVGATTGGASPITNSNVPFTFQLVVN